MHTSFVLPELRIILVWQERAKEKNVPTYTSAQSVLRFVQKQTEKSYINHSDFAAW
jgi:hypothetical protein